MPQPLRNHRLSLGSRIVGGQEAPPHAFYYQVNINVNMWFLQTDQLRFSVTGCHLYIQWGRKTSLRRIFDIHKICSHRSPLLRKVSNWFFPQSLDKVGSTIVSRGNFSPVVDGYWASQLSILRCRAFEATVMLGVHNLISEEATRQEQQSTKFVVHEGWSRSSVSNDIGLIELPEEVELNG